MVSRMRDLRAITLRSGNFPSSGYEARSHCARSSVDQKARCKQ